MHSWRRTRGKEGVVTLPSGLQYKILKEGTGAKPTAEDSVVCNYKGTLINGTEFDSSYKRNEPATFPVGGVIKGWTEALQLMPVGSKWQLFIPADLAYGARGTPGGPIGPNSTLIFEVELLSIKEKTPPPDKVPAPAAAPEKTSGWWRNCVTDRLHHHQHRRPRRRSNDSFASQGTVSKRDGPFCISANGSLTRAFSVCRSSLCRSLKLLPPAADGSDRVLPPS